jgi:hypothetical protein
VKYFKSKIKYYMTYKKKSILNGLVLLYSVWEINWEAYTKCNTVKGNYNFYISTSCYINRIIVKYHYCRTSFLRIIELKRSIDVAQDLTPNPKICLSFVMFTKKMHFKWRTTPTVQSYPHKEMHKVLSNWNTIYLCLKIKR